jgi:hypothetical protein
MRLQYDSQKKRVEEKLALKLQRGTIIKERTFFLWIHPGLTGCEAAL